LKRETKSQKVKTGRSKIFNGIAAGTIPVVSPEHFIQINYKVVLSMGLTVPESLLAQADEIIR